MKRFLMILVMGLLLSSNAYAKKIKNGSGPLKLSDNAIANAGIKNLPIICKASKDRYNSRELYVLNYDQLKEFKDELLNNPKLILKENWINHEQQIKSKKLKCPDRSRKFKPYVKKSNKISNTYVSVSNSKISKAFSPNPNFLAVVANLLTPNLFATS